MDQPTATNEARRTKGILLNNRELTVERLKYTQK
jgi:hypothetical protein